jgi:hypothetical protein
VPGAVGFILGKQFSCAGGPLAAKRKTAALSASRYVRHAGAMDNHAGGGGGTGPSDSGRTDYRGWSVGGRCGDRLALGWLVRRRPANGRPTPLDLIDNVVDCFNI